MLVLLCDYYSLKFDYFDIYVSAALWEGLPTGLIEASLAKIPIVATNCTGNIDVINNERGYLYETGDFKAAVDLIEYIIRNKEENNEKIINAYKFSLEKFSIEKNIELLERLYMEVLDESFTNS